MNGLEFRHRGREMVDYLVDYLDNIDARRVTPNIEPGYLQQLIPTEPPDQPEDWDTIMDDVEKKIMIGVTHWQHPRFHAYFPAGNSYPSILGDMLGDAIGCVGFSWAASPACTELETIMLDWMGKMIGLPDEFLTNRKGSKGGGVIQSSASECVLDCLLAARTQAIRHLRSKAQAAGSEDLEETTLLSKLMAYCSKEAHSCVEKAAMIGFVRLRILEPDENCDLRGDILKQAMEEDIANGLHPFFVSATLGTTGCCAFDNLEEIGPVCEEHGVWLHVDAAYAGNSFICPENQYLMKGIEYAMSFNTNPNKWMLVNFDCSLMWVKDRFKLTQALVVDPLYLQHSYSESAIDYRHWGIPLSRRFRSLKLWFVIRTYGVSGLQAYVREHCRLAKVFEALVRTDRRFQVCNNVRVGLVCFRLKGSDELNQKLLSTINASGKLHMVPANVNDKFVIRFAICSQNATDDDIDYAWKTIAKIATDVITKVELLGETVSTRPTVVLHQEDEQTTAVAPDVEDEIATDPEESVEDVEKKTAEILALQAAEEKKKQTLAYKRSFFVRMVSDPKIYNPKIVKIKSADGRGTLESITQQEVSPTSPPAMQHTWISWPLAFIIKSGMAAKQREKDKESASGMKMRFRNWDTQIAITPAKRIEEKDEEYGDVFHSPGNLSPTNGALVGKGPFDERNMRNNCNGDRNSIEEVSDHSDESEGRGFLAADGKPGGGGKGGGVPKTPPPRQQAILKRNKQITNGNSEDPDEENR